MLATPSKGVVHACSNRRVYRPAIDTLGEQSHGDEKSLGGAGRARRMDIQRVVEGMRKGPGRYTASTRSRMKRTVGRVEIAATKTRGG